jgi:hypothetical protein
MAKSWKVASIRAMGQQQKLIRDLTGATGTEAAAIWERIRDEWFDGETQGAAFFETFIRTLHKKGMLASYVERVRSGSSAPVREVGGDR